MSSSHRNLQTASGRFEAAEHSAIDCIGVEWSEFSGFELVLSRYIDLCDRVAYDDARRSELQALRQARHLLSRLPIHPNHELVGLAALNLSDPRSPESEIDTLRADCLHHARELLGSKHPAAKLEALLRANLTDSELIERRVALVAPEKYHDAVRMCIDLGGISFELVSQSQLKHGGVWDAAIYLGPQHSSYPGTPLELRKKKVAWMYSAPASRRTIQILWSGGFDIAEFTLWSESPLSLRRSVGLTRLRVFVDEIQSPPPPPPPPPSSDGVQGFVIDLAGDFRVLLSHEHGPRAHVIQMNDFNVTIESESADRLARGDTLLLRVDRTAREFVINSASKKMGRSVYEKAKAASSGFKQRVVTKETENRTESEARLREAGIANASYYLNACADLEYIAPGKFEQYRKICIALGIAHSVDEYTLFKKMRAAHRTAGSDARERIQDKLKLDRSWEDETREKGFSLHDFEDLGNILIAAIVKITPMNVTLSTLGRVQKDGNYVD